METQDIIRDYDSKVANNFTYKIKGTTDSYRILSKYGVVTGGYASDHWAHKEKQSYYQQKDISNALFPSKTIYAKQISWFVPQVTIQGLISGIYHVYLRHGAYNDVYLPQDTDVILYVNDGNGQKLINTMKPFNQQLIQALKANDKKLLSSYVFSVDLSDFPTDEQIEVMIKICNTSGNWKGNWLFEGAILVPASSLTNVPRFVQLGRDLIETTVSEKEEAEVQLFCGKIKMPPGFIERDRPDDAFQKYQQETAKQVLSEPIDKGAQIRPIDLFSLDSTFYEDLGKAKFAAKDITRKGSQSGRYSCFCIVEDETSTDVNQRNYRVGVADLKAGHDFLSEGLESGYFNWVQIKADDGEIVKVVIMETNLGKIANKSKDSIGFERIAWRNDEIPDGSLTWRWYTSQDGRDVAVITIE